MGRIGAVTERCESRFVCARLYAVYAGCEYDSSTTDKATISPSWSYIKLAFRENQISRSIIALLLLSRTHTAMSIL